MRRSSERPTRRPPPGPASARPSSAAAEFRYVEMIESSVDSSKSRTFAMSRSRMFATDRLARWQLSRRQVLRSAGAGFGYLALAGHARPACRAASARARRSRPAGAEAAALPGQGQADHLPVHGRGHVADGHLGIQAAAPAERRQARPGRRHPDRARSSSFRQHGQTGTWVSELFPHTGPARRQALLPSRAAHRHAGPSRRPSSSSTPARPWRRSPGRRWARGCSTAWAPRTRTCPATSRSTRRPTSAARSTTAAPSSRPTSRGRASTTAATCRT